MNKHPGDPGTQGYRLLYRTFTGEALGIPIPVEEIHWESLLGVAHRNRLSPLLFRLLEDSDQLHRIPGAAAARLKESYFQGMEYGIRILEAHHQIAESFEKNGISHVDLRGIDWVYSLYDGNPALRPMLDLDLFVPQECFGGAESVLREIHAFERVPIKPHHDQHEVFRKGLVFVELHRKLFIDPLLAIFPDFVVDGSPDRVISIQGRPLACLHYWIHAHRPAVRLCDFVRLPEYPTADCSPSLKALFSCTERQIRDASQGDPRPFEDGNYAGFWVNFLGKAFLRSVLRNPLEGFKLARLLAEWQIKRYSRARRR